MYLRILNKAFEISYLQENADQCSKRNASTSSEIVQVCVYINTYSCHYIAVNSCMPKPALSSEKYFYLAVTQTIVSFV